jgi:hypothetical protein
MKNKQEYEINKKYIILEKQKGFSNSLIEIQVIDKTKSGKYIKVKQLNQLNTENPWTYWIKSEIEILEEIV